MFNVLLTPVVTLPVIAALAITIVAQGYLDARRTHDRLREQAKRLGKMSVALLAAATVVHRHDTERQIGHAVEATIDALKNVGFDKLASGEVTFAGVMFGDTPFNPDMVRRNPFETRRQGERDPFSEFSFSLDDLKEALRPQGDGGTVLKSALRPGEGPNGEKYAPTSFDSIEPHEDALRREGNGGISDEGAGLGGKGQRPYHKSQADLSDFGGADFGGRSPRAG